MTSITGRNSVANLQKKHTKIYNTNVDLVNDNVFTKFGLILSIRSPDIEQKPNSDVKLELMFMKHNAPNRCLYIKVAKLRIGVGSAEMSHLQNCSLKIYLKRALGGGGGSGWGDLGWL